MPGRKKIILECPKVGRDTWHFWMNTVNGAQEEGGVGEETGQWSQIIQGMMEALRALSSR